MTVDLVIAGWRIRLCSHEGVSLLPDERFSAFTVPDEEGSGPGADCETDFFAGGNYGSSSVGTGDQTSGVSRDRSAGSKPGLCVWGSRDSPAGGEPDLFVEVEAGTVLIPPDAKKVFDAQLMEEVPGGLKNTGAPFWEIFAGGGTTYARVYIQDTDRIPVLVMPHAAKRWQIFAGGHQNGVRPDYLNADLRTETLNAGVYLQENPGQDQQDASGHHQQSGSSGNFSEPLSAYGSATDRSADALSRKQSSAGKTAEMLNPLPYPLDGLLLYFLFSKGGDIMIHGSGVVSGGRGWLFTGRSGSGKTTMARIFDSAGDRVIHDDRLVLRRERSGWVMHNTPVYRNDEPRSAPLDHLWVIRHGTANVSEPVAGAEAVAMILSNCIQQNWDREAASQLAAAADDLMVSVNVSRLSFLPDASIRDYLLLRETPDKALAADAVLSMLDEGCSVTVTAGGYSMWPAIRPGDAVIIAPCGDSVAAAGQIVALRRDGGFVLHRITQVMTVSGRKLIVTCGDAAARADEPAGAEMIAGVVQSVNRSGRLIPPPRRRWPRWLNRMGTLVAGWVRG